jgi:hypothetical protein
MGFWDSSTAAEGAPVSELGAAAQAEFTKVRHVRSTFFALLLFVPVTVVVAALDGWSAKSALESNKPLPREDFTPEQAGLEHVRVHRRHPHPTLRGQGAETAGGGVAVHLVPLRLRSNGRPARSPAARSTARATAGAHSITGLAGPTPVGSARPRAVRRA